MVHFVSAAGTMESDSKEEDKTCEINAHIIDKPTPQVSQEAADKNDKENEDVHDVSELISPNNKDVHDVAETISPNNDDVHDAEGPISPNNEDVHDAEGPISPNNEDVHDAEGPISPNNEDVHDAEGPISPNNEDVHDAEGPISPNNEDVHDAEGPISPNNEDVHDAAGPISPNNEDVHDAEGPISPNNEDVHDVSESISPNRFEASTDDDQVHLTIFGSKQVSKCEDLIPESKQLKISQFDDISDESRSDAVIGEESSTCITDPLVICDSDVVSANETEQSMDSIDKENVVIADNDVISADNIHSSNRNDIEIIHNVLNIEHISHHKDCKDIERAEEEENQVNNGADKCSPIETETIEIAKEVSMPNQCKQEEASKITLENVPSTIACSELDEASGGKNVDNEVAHVTSNRDNVMDEMIQDAGCWDALSSDEDQHEAVATEILTFGSQQSEKAKDEKDVNFCEQAIAEKPDIPNETMQQQKDTHSEDIEEDSFEYVTAISTDVKAVTSSNEEGVISKATESNVKAHTALVDYESSGEDIDEEMEVDETDILLEESKEHQTKDDTTSRVLPVLDIVPDSTKGFVAEKSDEQENLCQEPENFPEVLLADKSSKASKIDPNEGKDNLEEHLPVTKETSTPASMVAEVEVPLPVDEADIELNEEDSSSTQYHHQESTDICLNAEESAVLNEPTESESSSRDSNEAVDIPITSKSPEISSKEDFNSVEIHARAISEYHGDDIKTTNDDKHAGLEDRERCDDENSIEIIESDDEISEQDSEAQQMDCEAFRNDNVNDFENDEIESTFIDTVSEAKDSLDLLSQQSDEGNEESLSAVAEFQSKPTPDWSMADDNAQSNDTELAISEQKCENGELQGRIEKLPAVAAEIDEQAGCSTSSDLLEAGDESMSTEPPPSKRSRKGSIGSAANDASNDVDMIDDYGQSVLPPENLFEYLWPPEQGGEFYMLQEQISEYLGIKSFKRKYPDLQRRPVEMKEKEFLRERGVVNETQCDLGLTALKSDEVHDLMHKDYPDRYQEYVHVLHEKERQTIRDKHREYGVPKLEKGKMAAYIKKAVKSAADFNSRLQKKRREERRAYFDLQTMAIHFPEGRYKKMDPESTKVSSYPVVLIPGQFQEFYQQYTSDELKYFPLQTTLYDPPKQFKSNLAKLSSGDSSEDMDDSAEDKSVSDSDDSDGSSDSDDSVDGSKTKEADKDDVSNAQPPVVEPKIEPPSTPDPKTMRCRACNKGPGGKKRYYKAEEMVQCSECKQCGHPSCLQLSAKMVPVIKSYPWQCMECKTCVECLDPYDEDKMMFCDKCDRGYHTFCVGMKSLPKGCWECVSCTGEEPKSAKKIKRL